MRQCHCLTGTLAIVVACCFAAPVRADLYALTNAASGPFRVAHWDGNGRFVRNIPGVVESTDGLTVTPDGWLYVAGNTLGSGTLYRQRAATLNGWQAVTPFTPGPYSGPSGLTTGPDGSVYGSSNAFLGNRNSVSGVLRYNPADGSFRQVVSVTGSSQFSLSHVAVAPNGDIYLAHDQVGVERFAGATGERLGVIPWSATGPIADIDFGPDGNLYASTSAGVDRYQPQTGTLIDHFIPVGTGGLGTSFDLAFGGDGLIYVNSRSNNSVLRYDAASGAFRDVFVTPDQYALAGAGGVFQLAYLVPEPTSCAGLLASALLLRRRRC